MENLIQHTAVFAVAVLAFKAAREIVDNFLNCYGLDRAVGYGLCGGLGVWAALAIYSAPLFWA